MFKAGQVGDSRQPTITTISKPKPAANLDYLVAQAIYSRDRLFTLPEPEDMEILIKPSRKRLGLRRLLAAIRYPGIY